MSDRQSDDPSSGIVSLLEDFFAEPTFTTAVSDFAAQHAASLGSLSAHSEQPLHAHALYQEYTAMVEDLLSDFLARHGLTNEAVLAAAQHADRSVNTCVDYLLASTEYDAFIGLMADFNGMSQWDVEADDAYGELGALESSLEASSLEPAAHERSI